MLNNTVPPKRMKTLTDLLKKFNPFRLSGKVASKTTQHDRKKCLIKMFRDLYALDFRIKDIHALKTKHIKAILEKWLTDIREGKRKSGKRIATDISFLRALAKWIKKEDLVDKAITLLSKEDRDLLDTLKRTGNKEGDTTYQNKSWYAKGIDPVHKIQEVAALCEHCAIQMTLQFLFGLRFEESAKFKPLIAIHEQYIDVGRGAKTGRPRTVAIDEPVQREMLEVAKTFVTHPNQSLIPGHYTYAQWKDHYYHVMRKCGITRKVLGVTSHGLRHTYAQRHFFKECQVLLDVLRQPETNQLEAEIIALQSQCKVDPSESLFDDCQDLMNNLRQPESSLSKADIIDLAQYRVTENVGHSRKEIFSVYAPVNELKSDTDNDDWEIPDDLFTGIKPFSEYASENSNKVESEQEETQPLSKDKDE